MRYKDTQQFSDIQFKRLTGISWSTFDVMLTELKQHLHVKGRPCKLDLEDQLLLCLNYWREYRILFHVGMYTIYEKSLIAVKAKKGQKLDPELKVYNREVNRTCIWSIKII